MKIVQCLVHEVRELYGRALYFLGCFTMILLIIKLILERYEISLDIWPKILLGSFIAAKATFLTDNTGIIKRQESRPRYINIIYKTLLYTLMSIYILLMESFLKGLLATKNIGSAFDKALHENQSSPMLAIIVFLFFVYLNYNIILEIDSYLGGNKLKKFFFGLPQQRNI